MAQDFDIRCYPIYHINRHGLALSTFMRSSGTDSKAIGIPFCCLLNEHQQLEIDYMYFFIFFPFSG